MLTRRMVELGLENGARVDGWAELERGRDSSSGASGRSRSPICQRCPAGLWGYFLRQPIGSVRARRPDRSCGLARLGRREPPERVHRL